MRDFEYCKPPKEKIYLVDLGIFFRVSKIVTTASLLRRINYCIKTNRIPKESDVIALELHKLGM